jgi:SAM-dependent methyltransferase
MAKTATNFQQQDSSDPALAQAANYAVQVANGYQMWLSQAPDLLNAGSPSPLEGLSILELGPGPTLGSAVLLVCKGAQVAVADRFLPAWDEAFHPAFFRVLRQTALESGWSNVAPIDAVLEQGGFSGALDCYSVGAEQLDAIDGTFDVVLSNAVLEHIEDLDRTVASLARKIPAGGYGFHQIDMRDHRSLDRPLEYLTIDRGEFDNLRRDLLCECGAQWRASEYEAAFARVGFEVTTWPNMSVDPQYLAEIRPRLRPEFADLPSEDLSTISALLVMRRRAVSAVRVAA